MTRHGKIGQMPVAVREELNRRMLDGARANDLIAWLSMLPEVRTVLDRQFGGRPINEPNITAWRQGGYRQWLREREARELARHLGQEALAGDPEGGPPPTEALAWWLTAHFVACVREILPTVKGEAVLKLFHKMLVPDLAALRRGDHSAQRLEIQRDRLSSRPVRQLPPSGETATAPPAGSAASAAAPPSESAASATAPPSESAVSATAPPSEPAVSATAPPAESAVSAIAPPAESAVPATAPPDGSAASRN